MQKRTVLTLSLLAILICSWSATSVHAASVTYKISDERVSVALTLNFYQNATAMPALNATFTGAPAQELTSALEEGLKKKADGVSVSSLSGQLVSSKNWTNSTIRFELAGVSSRKGNLLVFNCSWIPFNVSRDLRLGNLTYNLIGATYIRPTFENYVNFDKPPLNETISSVTYLSGGVEIVSTVAVNRAGNATLLDFSRLILPFDQWKQSYNVTEGLTSWSYNPDPAVDMTMTVTPREGTPFVNRALYQYNATVSVNGLAHAQRNAISTEASGGIEPLLMLAVVIVTFAVAVVSGWSYRSRRKRLPRRRK